MFSRRPTEERREGLLNSLEDEDEFQENYPNARRVYITNYVSHDYEAAKEYGRLVPVVKGSPGDLPPEKLEAQIHAILADTDSNDYLLLSGNLLATTLAVAFMLRKHGSVNALIFDVVARMYTTYSITGDYVAL